MKANDMLVRAVILQAKQDFVKCKVNTAEYRSAYAYAKFLEDVFGYKRGTIINDWKMAREEVQSYKCDRRKYRNETQNYKHRTGTFKRTGYGISKIS